MGILAEPVPKRLARNGAILVGDNRAVAAILAVSVIGFIVRMLWLARNGTGWAFTFDSFGYMALASGIRHGCGFAPLLNGRCGRTEVMWMPGYPVFLAALKNDVKLILIIQAVLEAVVCAAAGLFAMRRFGKMAGLIACVLLAFDFPSINSAKQIMTESVFQFGLAMGILSLLSAAQAEREGRSALLKIASGALTIGIAGLVRPLVEVIIPLLCILFLTISGVSLRRGLILAALAVCLPAAVLSLWMFRNHRVADVWTITPEGSMNLFLFTASGVKYYAGEGSLAAVHDELSDEIKPKRAMLSDSCLQSIGEKWYDHIECMAATQPSTAATMSRVAVGVMIRHPLSTAEVVAIGLMRLCFVPYWPTPVETRGREAAGRRKPLMRLVIGGTVGFQLVVLAILLFGIARLLLTMLRTGYLREATVYFLFGSAMLLLLAAAPFYADTAIRFRTPAIPYLAILAGAGWSLPIRWKRRLLFWQPAALPPIPAIGEAGGSAN